MFDILSINFTYFLKYLNRYVAFIEISFLVIQNICFFNFVVSVYSGIKDWTWREQADMVKWTKVCSHYFVDDFDICYETSRHVLNTFYDFQLDIPISFWTIDHLSKINMLLKACETLLAYPDCLRTSASCCRSEQLTKL